MPSPSEPTILLLHGTTRQRAEAILLSGPDLDYEEDPGPDSAKGFSTAPPDGNWPFGSPHEYARRKARLYPLEGGPVLLELKVPLSTVCLAMRLDEELPESWSADMPLEDLTAIVRKWGEVRFGPEIGFEGLLEAWPSLEKRILSL